jgi:hypothetical protein
VSVTIVGVKSKGAGQLGCFALWLFQKLAAQNNS